LLKPRLARPPAMMDEQACGRRQHVGNAVAQVAAAVAVEIDAALDIVGREELHLADFARPGAHQLFGRQVAAIENLKSGEELRPELLRPPAIEGKGCKRAQS